MILGVSRLATMRAIVLAKHSPKRKVAGTVSFLEEAEFNKVMMVPSSD